MHYYTQKNVGPIRITFSTTAEKAKAAVKTLYAEIDHFASPTYFTDAELDQYELLGGGWRNSLLFLEKIRKVTAAEVQAAAKKYMVNVRFTFVGNPDNVDRSVFLQN